MAAAVKGTAESVPRRGNPLLLCALSCGYERANGRPVHAGEINIRTQAIVRGQMVSDGVQLRGGRDHPGVRFRAAASGEHFFLLRFAVRLRGDFLRVAFVPCAAAASAQAQAEGKRQRQGQKEGCCLFHDASSVSSFHRWMVLYECRRPCKADRHDSTDYLRFTVQVAFFWQVAYRLFFLARQRAFAVSADTLPALIAGSYRSVRDTSPPFFPKEVPVHSR